MKDDEEVFSALRALLDAALDAVSPSALEAIAAVGRDYLRDECPAWVARGWIRIFSEVTLGELRALRELASAAVKAIGRRVHPWPRSGLSAVVPIGWSCLLALRSATGPTKNAKRDPGAAGEGRVARSFRPCRETVRSAASARRGDDAGEPGGVAAKQQSVTGYAAIHRARVQRDAGVGSCVSPRIGYRRRTSRGHTGTVIGGVSATSTSE